MFVMIRYNMIFVFIAVELFTSCSDKKNNLKDGIVENEVCLKDTFQVIDLEKVIEDKMPFCDVSKSNLSSISDSVTYIILGSKTDSGEEIYTNKILQTFVGEKYIVLNCVDKVLLFDKSGKLLYQIGQVGQGPGDYVMASYVSVNETSDRIYINNSGQKLLTYDFQGNFLQSIPFNDANYFSVLKDNQFALSFDNLIGDVPYRMIIKNEKSDTVVAFENYVKFPRKQFSFYSMDPFEQRFYQFKGDVFYKENYNDTIFKIENNGLVPRYCIYLGKYKNPVHARVEYLNTNEERMDISSKYYKVNLIESNKGLFIHYKSLHYDSERCCTNGYIYYDKVTDAYSYISPSSLSRVVVFGSGFENDIDGGSIFLPKGTSSDGKSLFSTYNASDFKEKIEKAGYYDKIKYPEKQKALKKMVDSIDESTNVIIMVATLK